MPRNTRTSCMDCGGPTVSLARRNGVRCYSCARAYKLRNKPTHRAEATP